MSENFEAVSQNEMHEGGLTDLYKKVVKEIREQQLDIAQVSQALDRYSAVHNIIPSSGFGKTIERYKQDLQYIEEETRKKGVLPDIICVSNFPHTEGFRDAVKSAAAREMLKIGFGSFKTLDQVKDALDILENYEPQGIDNGEGGVLDIGVVFRRLDQIQANLKEKRKVPFVWFSVFPAQYDLKGAVMDIVGDQIEY